MLSDLEFCQVVVGSVSPPRFPASPMLSAGDRANQIKTGAASYAGNGRDSELTLSFQKRIVHSEKATCDSLAEAGDMALI